MASLLTASFLHEESPSAPPALIFLEPNQPARHVSRSEFGRGVRHCAAGLRSWGVSAGDVVAITGTHRLEVLYSFWGAMWLGAVPTILAPLTEKLDPTIYDDRLGKLVAHAEVKLVIAEQGAGGKLATKLGCEVVSFEALANGKTDSLNTPIPPAEEDGLAFIQHSSGTTGLQKGVALTHTAVLAQLAQYAKAIALTQDDVIVSWLPLYHDMGLIAGFLLPLISGVPLVLMSPFAWVRQPALLLQTLSEYNGTLCWLPNFAYNHCARRVRSRQLEGVSLAHVRGFINCSEPARASSHALFVERFAAVGVREEQLAVCYAMAENTFAVTQTPLGRGAAVDHVNLDRLQREQVAAPNGDYAVVSCGSPLAGTRLRIVAPDNPHKKMPDRQIGRIQLQSNCLLDRYYRRADLEPFTADGWYDTADMGYLAAGELYVIGRAKEIIINAGKNIYPQDIEAIIGAVDGIKAGRVVVFGVMDEREGTELLAAVAEYDPDHPRPEPELKRAIRHAVAQQSMVTLSYATLVETKWLIKTSSGKLARGANRQKWLDN